uniref:Uncharacterized protein n=1 Tax=Melopsittacus undulatus TaxID=13146 RepID=A0A8V5G845_MELUD
MSDGPWVGSWRPHRPRAPIAALYTSPGPKYGLPSSVGRYSVERAARIVFPTAPACSLSPRTRHEAVQHTPGPSAYHLPPMLGPHLVSKTSAPSYSMTGRSTVGSFYEDLCKNPGPGRYRTVDTDVYKHRAPRFSMVARNVPPGDKTAKPGPAAYSPQQSRPQGVTFGIRHSEYLAPLIVDVPD